MACYARHRAAPVGPSRSLPPTVISLRLLPPLSRWPGVWDLEQLASVVAG